MHLFSPDRPQIAHRPAYINSSGHPIAPIPQFTLQPLPDENLVRIDLIVKYPDGSFGYLTKNIAVDFLPTLYREWLANPEQIMASIWEYIPPTTLAKSSPPKPTISLADLGL